MGGLAKSMIFIPVVSVCPPLPPVPPPQQYVTPLWTEL